MIGEGKIRFYNTALLITLPRLDREIKFMFIVPSSVFAMSFRPYRVVLQCASSGVFRPLTFLKKSANLYQIW